MTWHSELLIMLMRVSLFSVWARSINFKYNWFSVLGCRSMSIVLFDNKSLRACMDCNTPCSISLLSILSRESLYKTLRSSLNLFMQSLRSMLVTNRAISSSMVTGMYTVESFAVTSVLKSLRSFFIAAGDNVRNRGSLTFERCWGLGNHFPGIRFHRHLHVLLGCFLFKLAGVYQAELAVLDHFAVCLMGIHAVCFSKHGSHLLDCHVDSVFLEEGRDLAAVQSTPTIFVQSAKHVVDNLVRLGFSTGCIVMRMRVLYRSRFKPLLELFLLQSVLCLLMLHPNLLRRLKL